MKRLTEWDEYGNADIIALSDVMPEIYAELSFSETNALTDVLNRLAAYEDTGLEPEEIDTLQKREQGLAELLVNVSCGCAVSYTRLAELAQAEKDGRLVVLPPNDPLTLSELREMGRRCEGVYVVHMDGSPVLRGQRYCAAVLDFSLAFGSNGMHVHAIYGDRMTMWEDDYGKTWFAYRRKPEEGI